MNRRRAARLLWDIGPETTCPALLSLRAKRTQNDQSLEFNSVVLCVRSARQKEATARQDASAVLYAKHAGICSLLSLRPSQSSRCFNYISQGDKDWTLGNEV